MKMLKEPLVHFLLIGAALFVLYALVGDDSDQPDQIVVTQAKVDHLIELWVRTRQRPPTQQELSGLVDDYIIEEVLYREAKAMGLDEGDTIIRRRLRQKMEFIAEDLAALSEPSDQDLQLYLDEHPDAFALDARISFEHIFFNEDRRGESTFDDAVQARGQIAAGLLDPAEAGDGIPLPFELEASSTREVASMFGPQFADEMLTLPLGEWSGPVPSGYGLHLVHIKSMEAGRTPELAEVRDAVLREWSSEQRAKMREDFYNEFRSRYEIVIEPIDSTAAAPPSAPS